MMKAAVFTKYEDWRSTITGVCGMELTPEYCEVRMAALGDDADPATRAFVAAYGREYRDRVRGWFSRAGKEALS